MILIEVHVQNLQGIFTHHQNRKKSVTLHAACVLLSNDMIEVKKDSIGQKAVRERY